MFISLVIPVYNRPQEVRELLESLTHQTRRDFETVVVEDGSAPELSSDGVVREYADRLDICYVRQPNGGPAAARNTGAAHAHGDFLVIMDSDCIVPPGYFETVYAEVEARGIAFYGGPDMAAPDFSPLQKAVSYSMTSVFTTGGIRGNRRSIGKFSPRSFNLGISRPLFEQVGGFSDMRIGEDIDFSMRVMAAGAQAWFLPDAKVCHKRRTSIRLFFKQVFVFGTARVNLDIRHPEWFGGTAACRVMHEPLVPARRCRSGGPLGSRHSRSVGRPAAGPLWCRLCALVVQPSFRGAHAAVVRGRLGA